MTADVAVFANLPDTGLPPLPGLQGLPGLTTDTPAETAKKASAADKRTVSWFDSLGGKIEDIALILLGVVLIVAGLFVAVMSSETGGKIIDAAGTAAELAAV